MSSDPPFRPPIVLALNAADYANETRAARARRGRPRWVDNFMSLRRFGQLQPAPESFHLLEARTLPPGEIIYLPCPPSNHQGSEPVSSSQTVNPEVIILDESPPRTNPVTGAAGKLIKVEAGTSGGTVQPKAMRDGETPPATKLLIGKPMIKAATASFVKKEDDDDDDVMIIGETRSTPRLLTAFPAAAEAARAARAPKSVADAMPAPSSSRKRAKKAKGESNKEAGTACSSSMEIIHVDVGEDIVDAVMKYSLKRQHSICILGACGNVSKAVLRVPGDVLPKVYEGELIISTMGGSFVCPVPGGTEMDRAGSLSLSVSGSTCVFGGRIAGSVIASTKVQMTVLSFTTPSEPQPLQQVEASGHEQRQAGNYRAS